MEYSAHTAFGLYICVVKACAIFSILIDIDCFVVFHAVFIKAEVLNISVRRSVTYAQQDIIALATIIFVQFLNALEKE